MGDRDRLDVLYQDARWLRIARFQYGIIAVPLWLLGLVGDPNTQLWLDEARRSLAAHAPDDGETDGWSESRNSTLEQDP